MDDRIDRGRAIPARQPLESKMHRKRVEGLAAIGQIGRKRIDVRMIKRLQVDIEDFVSLIEQIRNNMTAGFPAPTGKDDAFAQFENPSG